MTTQQSKPVGHWESSPKGEIHSISNLSQKTRKSSIKWSNFTLKGTWKRATNKAPSEQKGGNNKDQSRNQWNGVVRNDTKDQWIHELVLWKDKQDWQIFNQTHQERKKGVPAKMEKHFTSLHNQKEHNNQYKINKQPEMWKNQTAWTLTTTELKKQSNRTTRLVRWQMERNRGKAADRTGRAGHSKVVGCTGVADIMENWDSE